MLLKVHNIRTASAGPVGVFFLCHLVAFSLVLGIIKSWKIPFAELNNKNINAASVYRNEPVYNSMRDGKTNDFTISEYNISDTTLAEYYRLYINEYCSGIHLQTGWSEIQCFYWNTVYGIDEIYTDRNTNIATSTLGQPQRVEYFMDKTGTSRRSLSKLFYALIGSIVLAVISYGLYWSYFTSLKTGFYWFWKCFVLYVCLVPVIESLVLVVVTNNMYNNLKGRIDVKNSSSGVSSEYNYTFQSLCVVILSAVGMAFMICLFNVLCLRPVSSTVEVVEQYEEYPEQAPVTATINITAAPMVPTQTPICPIPTPPPAYVKNEQNRQWLPWPNHPIGFMQVNMQAFYQALPLHSSRSTRTTTYTTYYDA